jgi:hypothetical protein
MTWEHLTDTCASTDEMLSDLCDWAAGFSTAPFTKEAVGGAGVYTRSESVTLAGNAPSATFTATLRCLSRGGQRYWLAHNESNGIFCKLSKAATAITASAPTFDSMTVVSGGDHSRASRCYPVSGANKYWFFKSDDDMTVHVRFRRANGSWQAFSFGKMEKTDDADWTGGEYFDPQCASDELAQWTLSASSAIHYINRPLFGSSTTYLPTAGNPVDVYGFGVYRVDYAGLTYALASIAPGTDLDPATYGHAKVCLYGGAQHYDFGFVDTNTSLATSPASFNARSAGQPPLLFLYDRAGTGLMLYMGTVPGVRHLNIGTMVAEQTVNDDWVVFPETSTGPGDATHGTGYVSSGILGVAYYAPGV